MISDVKQSVEYRLIRQFYGVKQAKRSKVPLMKHIDEGLLILRYLSAHEYAMRAYCLHPLLQNDDDLFENFSFVSNQIKKEVGAVQIMAYAMEYRSVANEYLAKNVMPKNGIRLSPIRIVNQMLIADKVQNRKDFLLYHHGKHENSDRLMEYFDQWCEALEINPNNFTHLFENTK